MGAGAVFQRRRMLFAALTAALWPCPHAMLQQIAWLFATPGIKDTRGAGRIDGRHPTAGFLHLAGGFVGEAVPALGQGRGLRA